MKAKWKAAYGWETLEQIKSRSQEGLWGILVDLFKAIDEIEEGGWDGAGAMEDPAGEWELGKECPFKSGTQRGITGLMS